MEKNIVLGVLFDNRRFLVERVSQGKYRIHELNADGDMQGSPFDAAAINAVAVEISAAHV